MTARPVIRLKAGTDATVRVGIRASDGSARNLTGEIIYFRAAPSLESTAATISKQDGDGITVVNAALGLVDLTFDRDETLVLPDLLLWDMKVVDTSGLAHKVDFGTDAAQPATYGLMVTERPLLQAG